MGSKKGPCPEGFKGCTFFSGVWPPELCDGLFLLFRGAQGVVPAYSSHRKHLYRPNRSDSTIKKSALLSFGTWPLPCPWGTLSEPSSLCLPPSGFCLPQCLSRACLKKLESIYFRHFGFRPKKPPSTFFSVLLASLVSSSLTQTKGQSLLSLKPKVFTVS